jgi:hypothetical protein
MAIVGRIANQLDIGKFSVMRCRVNFFKDLVSSEGQPSSRLQQSIEISGAENIDCAVEDAKRRYERLCRVPLWSLYADRLELENDRQRIAYPANSRAAPFTVPGDGADQADAASVLRLSVQPVVDVFAHLILGQAVALLDLAFQLIAAAVNLGQIIVGQLSPLLLDFACCLLPVPFDPVPIHLCCLLVVGCRDV